MNALNDSHIPSDHLPLCSTLVRAVGAYVIAHSYLFVQEGADWLDPTQKSRRSRAIEGVGEDLRQLSIGILSNQTIGYRHFDSLLDRLHRLGVYPPLVGHVSRAFRAAGR